MKVWKIRKFFLRWRTAWNIISGKYKHWTLVVVSRKQFEQMLLEKDFGVLRIDHGMREYNVAYLIRQLADSVDDDEMIMMKADYEADAVLRGVDMDVITELRERE